MDIEHWKQKQKKIDTKLQHIPLYRYILNIGVVTLVYSVLLLIVFTLNNVNVLTNKSIPLYLNPLFLMFISIIFLLMYHFEKQGEKTI